MEEKFGFRERLEQVHAPARDMSLKAKRGETTIDASWQIIIDVGSDVVIAAAAEDLKEYFQVAMALSLEIKTVDLRQEDVDACRKKIFMSGSAISSKPSAEIKADHGCRLVCDRRNIHIVGVDEKAAARGGYALENMLTLRKGPYLKAVDLVLENRFSPRMVHSGWGLDIYPENYLRKIAHGGFDSILIYYKRADIVSPARITEVNDLITRAGRHGIGVYLYFQNWRDYDTMHPSETGAEEYYDGFYGRAFANHPGAVGCVLVGESCSFPSRDPGANGGNYDDRSKPHPGWWPCSDYPEWLALVKKVVVKHKADADIVFWTYNWGWAPEDKRIDLIRKLPDGVSLLVTFEMFEVLSRGKMKENCADYTIKFEGPGGYFASEAKAAKARGLRLYAMSNTGGMTWDFGAAPYIPVPFQWAKRWDKLLEARTMWELSGLMESHHYGWYPSYVSKLGDYFANSTTTDAPAKHLAALLDSDFGIDSRKRLLKAWRLWSGAIKLLPATAYDQYGALRVGPSYPFHFSDSDAPNIPSDADASHGSKIVVPFYSPEGFYTRQGHAIPIGEQVEFELRSVREMAEKWRRGVNEIEAGLGEVSAAGKPEYLRILALGRFIEHTLRTLINLKQWWQLRMALKAAPSPAKAGGILDEMIRLGEEEIRNTEETKAIVGMDSRLGWEPTMGYLTDKVRLSWKIERLRHEIDKAIPAYRESLR